MAPAVRIETALHLDGEFVMGDYLYWLDANDDLWVMVKEHDEEPRRIVDRELVRDLLLFSQAGVVTVTGGTAPATP